MTDSVLAAGIDIGGTKIAVALVDTEGRVLRGESLPTEAEQGFDRATGRIGDALRRLLEAACGGATGPIPTLAGIGIGCAGPVDPVSGLINNPYTLTGWNHCDIVSPLQARFGVPVRLENDADAAALGESWVGAGRGWDPVVMLTFGTGVGGGTIAGGRIQRGARGEHPELGHVPVDPAGLPCYCGMAGCLESVASGTALAEAGRPLGLDSARAVFRAARDGHPGAQGVVTRARHAVAVAAWTIGHTLLPSRLVLGGGIMETEFEDFAAVIRGRLSSATQFSQGAISVAQACLGNTAGVVGAARLVLGP